MRFILDTNVYSFAPEARLAQLAERGFQLSLSEIAFMEALARSAREYRSGVPRRRARGKFFARARRVAPYLDQACPVALGAGGITRRMAALLAGGPPDAAAEEHAAQLNEMWHVAIASEYRDRQWLSLAANAERWLTWRDDSVRVVVRAMQERPVGHGWAAMTETGRYAAARDSLAEFWGLTPVMAERLDAHVATVALRIIEAADGSRPASENDGADVHLTQHIAEACVVVTEDLRLVTLVDRAGTFQRPWVRRLDDLDDLPHGLPWGTSAREQAAAFKRRAPGCRF